MAPSKKPLDAIIGQRFGSRVVLRRQPKPIGRNKSYFILRCDCGTETIQNYSKIKTERPCRTCAVNNNIGRRYGKLICIEYINRYKRKMLCDCGKTTILSASNLSRSGRTVQSCGCMRHDKTVARAKALLGTTRGTLTYKRILGYTEEKKFPIIEAQCHCGKLKILRWRGINRSYKWGCGCERWKCGNQGKIKPVSLDADEKLMLMELYKSKVYKDEELIKIFSINERYFKQLIEQP
jgi:hypothetical protein